MVRWGDSCCTMGRGARGGGGCGCTGSSFRGAGEGRQKTRGELRSQGSFRPVSTLVYPGAPMTFIMPHTGSPDLDTLPIGLESVYPALHVRRAKLKSTQRAWLLV